MLCVRLSLMYVFRFEWEWFEAREANNESSEAFDILLPVTFDFNYTALMQLV